MCKQNKKKKIGILTLPLNTNYGGVLQAYALLTFMKSQGHDAWLINRRWNNDKNDPVYLTKKWFYHNIIARNFTKFKNEYLTPMTKPITSSQQMESINDEGFDAVIVGSDQVWRFEHTGGVKNNFFLDFITNDTKKISYAASFGIDHIKCDQEKKAEIRKLIQQFDGVSVREDSGVQICKSEFAVDAKHVIDPSLLLEKQDYLKIVDDVESNRIKNRLTTYILDDTDDKKQIISDISKNKSLTISSVNKKMGSYSFKNLLLNPNKIIIPSISQWIKGFNDAEFVVTDSFHGTAFCIIFNKPFVCIGNKERGLTRFTSLLKIFGLENRLILSQKDLTSDLLDKEIDFNKVNEVLNDKREEALQFIKKSLCTR